MALHIRDRGVDRLAADLAQLRRSTKTEVVKQALQRENGKLPLGERIKPIQDRLAAYRDSGLMTNKAFYDELSGEDER